MSRIDCVSHFAFLLQKTEQLFVCTNNVWQWLLKFPPWISWIYFDFEPLFIFIVWDCDCGDDDDDDIHFEDLITGYLICDLCSC